MKKRKLFTLVGSMCLVLVLAALLLPACAAPAPAPEAEPAWPKTLLFGNCSPPTSSWYPLHVKAAELGTRGTGIPTTNILIGGGAATLQAIYNGELDVGHATIPAQYESINGFGNWEGKPLENRLRLLYCRDSSTNVIAVRADSGIDSMADIAGKTVFCGFPGTTTHSQTTMCLDALGIDYKEFVGSLADGVTAFKDGRIDVFVKAALGRTVGSSHMDIMATTDIKFIGLTKEETKIVQAKYPWVMFTDLSAGWYEQLPDLGAFTANIQDNSGICPKDFPEELAYRWTKSVIDNYDEIRAVFPGAEYYDPVAALMRVPPEVYLHPGAVRYYREIGAEFPDWSIPPEMK